MNIWLVNIYCMEKRNINHSAVFPFRWRRTCKINSTHWKIA